MGVCNFLIASNDKAKKGGLIYLLEENVDLVGESDW